MRVTLEPHQIALREELQAYFAQLVTPEIRAGLASATGEFGEAGVYKDVIRQIGKDGWLGIGWPKEYGGQARSMVEQLIFTDVAAIAGVPIPYLTLNTVGPTIMRFGTEEQKDFFLPKILAGELHFSIGSSEP
jgi:alkylation response protein AidB-like acyl-CoA dehydrogenase